MQAVPTHHDNQALAAEAAAVLTAAAGTGVWPNVRDAFAALLGQAPAALDAWAAGLQTSARSAAQQGAQAEFEALLARAPDVHPALAQLTSQYRSLLTVPPPPPMPPGPAGGRGSRRTAAVVAAVVVVAGGVGALVWALTGSGGGGSASSSDSPAVDAQDSSGAASVWTGTYVNTTPASLTGGLRLSVVQNGTKLTGQVALDNVPGCQLDGPVTGTVDGNRITLHEQNGQDTLTIVGVTTDGHDMQGQYSTSCMHASGHFSANRSN